MDLVGVELLHTEVLQEQSQAGHAGQDSPHQLRLAMQAKIHLISSVWVGLDTHQDPYSDWTQGYHSRTAALDTASLHDRSMRTMYEAQARSGSWRHPPHNERAIEERDPIHDDGEAMYMQRRNGLTVDPVRPQAAKPLVITMMPGSDG